MLSKALPKTHKPAVKLFRLVKDRLVRGAHRQADGCRWF